MTSSFSYAVFKYVKDTQRDLTVPVGVALWSDNAQFVHMRFVRKDERINRINKADDLPYIELVARKLADWLKKRELPYQNAEMSPHSDEWWRHVRNLLVHRVRISEPLPIDCQDPYSELDPLFNTVVRPELSKNSSERIDSVLRNALGEIIANKFHRGPVEGYAGKPVHVMRVFRGADGDVILDAVNLSAEDAPEQADELVGKLQRVRLNGHGLVPKSRTVSAIVGYISDPEGLNGEAYLKSWIEQGGAAEVFDLHNEQQQLRRATQDAMNRVRNLLIDE